MDKRLRMTRRQWLATAVGSLALAGCGDSEPPSLKTLMERESFALFVDVLLPSHWPWLSRYRPQLMELFAGFEGHEAETVALVYQLFEARLEDGPDSHQKGNQALAKLLQDDIYAPGVNQTLDFIYDHISLFKGFDELWGRPLSSSGKQCIYWESYHEPVTTS